MNFRSFTAAAVNSGSDQLFLFGANVGFEINKFLTAEAGYNYDTLSSDFAGRGYDRNRLYLGLRAKY